MNKFLQYRTFNAVVEEGNLSAAARALNVTPAAVAKQLNQLESSLGVRLVDRTHQGVSPTDAGQSFYHRAREILHAVDDAEAGLSNQEASVEGTLVVTLSKSLLRSVVAEWMFEFSRLYPNVLLDIRTSEQVLDLYADNVDFALRLGKLGDSSRLYQNKLLSVSLCCVATPAYIEEYGKPDSMEDLINHRLIMPQSQNMSDQLRGMTKRHQTIFDRATVQTTNDIDVVRSSIVNGSCLGFLLDVDIKKELASGEFIELFPTSRVLVKPLYLVRKRSQQTAARLKCFREHMVARAGGLSLTKTVP